MHHKFTNLQFWSCCFSYGLKYQVEYHVIMIMGLHLTRKILRKSLLVTLFVIASKKNNLESYERDTYY